METESKQIGEITILYPKGVINMQSSPEFRDVLIEKFGNGAGRCIVNLSGVSYLDSSGLATLVEGLQIAQKGGGQFALCAITEPMIKDLLEMTRLTDAFQIFETEEEAVA